MAADAVPVMLKTDNNVGVLARLQHRVDLRNVDKNRMTSLAWAAIEGSLQVFEWLLVDYGHDDQELSRDSDGNTILHHLASIPSPPTSSPHAHLLKSSALFPPRPPKHSLAEQIAISIRMAHLYHTLFPFLLDWSNGSGKTALHLAALAGNTAFINLLCNAGADVNMTDLEGNTPLHFAAAWGHVETVRVLLERGCPLNARNYDAFTASDYVYSNTVLGAIQTIAKEIYEGRKQQRRRAEVDSRSRAGSVSTSLSNHSAGSGTPVSVPMKQPSRSHGVLDEGPPRQAVGPPRSVSDYDIGIPAPDFSAPPQSPSRPTSSGRPAKYRSPSLPTDSYGRPYDLAPPVPTIPTNTSSVAMRRANSAQTDISNSSGSALAPPSRASLQAHLVAVHPSRLHIHPPLACCKI